MRDLASTAAHDDGRLLQQLYTPFKTWFAFWFSGFLLAFCDRLVDAGETVGRIAEVNIVAL